MDHIKNPYGLWLVSPGLGLSAASASRPSAKDKKILIQEEDPNGSVSDPIGARESTKRLPGYRFLTMPH